MRLKSKLSKAVSLLTVCSMLTSMVPASPVFATKLETPETTISETIVQETAETTQEETTPPAETVEPETEKETALEETTAEETEEVTETETEEVTTAEEETTEEADEAEETDEETSKETPAETETQKETEQAAEVPDMGKKAVKSYDEDDFFTKSIIVIANKPEMIIDAQNVIGNYENIYLIQYATAKDAMNACAYYQSVGLVAEPDSLVEKADTTVTSNGDEVKVKMDEENNPLTSLGEELDDPTKIKESKTPLIALIDTGVKKDKNVLDSVSLIDDKEAGGTHGNDMKAIIIGKDADARIISVRAMNDDGFGTISSVISAIEYAIGQKADIINLSLFAKKTLKNTVLMSEIEKATKAGITVVGAAGNAGEDASEYVPGASEKAYIIGAATKDGVRQKTSNFGKTVDYYMTAESTSEAAAMFTGLVSAKGLKAADTFEGIFKKVAEPAAEKVEATEGAWGDDTIYDPVIESYVKEHADSKYTSVDKMEVAAALQVKNTIVDANKVGGKSTIDEVMTNDDQFVESFITQVESYVAVYNLSDSSKYYVALADTMHDNKASTVLDTDMALANYDGDDFSDYHYDKATGLVYIPKTRFATDGGQTIVNSLQMQLLQKTYVEGDFSVEDPVKAVITDGDKVSNISVSKDVFDFGVNANVEKDLDLDSLVVSINGLPVSTDLYYYNPTSGRFGINVPSAGIYNVAISSQGTKENQVSTAKETVYSASELPSVNKGNPVTGDLSDIAKGRIFFGTATVYYGSSDGKAYYSTDGWGDTLRFIAGKSKKLKSEYTYTKDAIEYQIKINSIELDKLDINFDEMGKTEKVMNCAHINSEKHHIWGDDGYDIDLDKKIDDNLHLGWHKYSKNVPIQARVIDVDDDYVILGVLTTGMWGQHGCGIFKIKVTPNNGGLKVTKRYTKGNLALNSSRIKNDEKTVKIGIYSDKKCTKEVETVKISMDQGEVQASKTVKLPAGKYYLKEISRTKGCTTNDTVYSTVVEEGKTTKEYINLSTGQSTKYIDNAPYSGQFHIVKTDNNGVKLANAIFKVEVRNYDSSQEEYASDHDVQYTWYFKSDANGNVIYDQAHYVPTWNGHNSDEPLTYTDEYTGATVWALPLCGITFTEVEAPAGYAMEKGSREFGFYNHNGKVNKDYSSEVLDYMIEIKDHKEWKNYYYAKNEFPTEVNPITVQPVHIEKKSTCPSVTNGHPLYTMAGIKYGIYSDAAATKLLHTLTLNANGVSNTVNMNPGTYYAREIKTDNLTYKYNDDIIRFVVGKTSTTVPAQDDPAADPVDIVLVKKTLEGSKFVNGQPSLEGAVYEINYYTNYTATGTPARTWKIRTDENGTARLDQRWLVNGSSELFKFSQPTDHLPLGSISIQEVSVPTSGGYEKDTGVYKAKIQMNSAKTDTDLVWTNVDSNTPTVKIARTGNTLTFTHYEKPVPQIGTTATSKDTNEHVGSTIEKAVTVNDVVAYSGLDSNKTYTLVGTLMNAKTNTAIKNSEGKDAVVTHSFKAKSDQEAPEDKDRTETLSFTVPVESVKDMQTVVFEELYEGDKVTAESKAIAAHAVATDEGQTVRFPDFHTNASDSVTGEHEGSAIEETATVVDLITYSNLLPGKDYEIRGKIMVKETGKPLVDEEGNEFTKTETLHCEESNGTYEMTFEIPSRLLRGNTVVVYENLYYDKVHLVAHENINDEDQSVSYPDIKTSVVNEATGTHTSNVDEEVTFIDTVTYKNLIPNETYVVKGVLMEKVADTNDEEATPAADESATDESKTDESATDESQTGESPVDEGNAESGAQDESAVTDEQSKTDVTEEPAYKVVELKSNGESVYGEQEFIASPTGDGTVDVTFKLNTKDLANRTTVVYEDLFRGEHHLVNHHDIEDKGQSMYIPDIHTNAVDGNTNAHEGDSSGMTTIIDTVTYENLVVGETYEIKGRLMERVIDDSTDEDETADVSTDDESSVADESAAATDESQNVDESNQTDESPAVDESNEATETAETTTEESEVKYKAVPVLDANGKEITATAKLENIDEPSGTVDLVYELDGTTVAGKRIVVFEKLLQNEVEITRHEDINDEDQSVDYPEVHTNAVDGTTNAKTSTIGDTTIVDTVTYKNLVPGATYTVKGVLMNQTEKTELLVNGEKVTGEQEFTASETGEGEVQVTFTLDSRSLEGITTVVFEDLFNAAGIKIATHSEITDEAQTVHFPEIHTNAVDDKTATHTGTLEDTAVIHDTVTYKNLIPGETYVVRGKLMDKNTEKPLLIEEKEIIGEAEFIASETGEGTVVVDFTLNSSALAGATVVVFEDLYYGEVKITDHAELTDEAQSVHYPEVHTNAVDDKTKAHTGTLEEKAVIHDTVTYKNLIPGEEYTVKGVLMNKTTRKEATIKDKQITGEASFIASETGEGTVVVDFKLDSNALAGVPVVVFEDLYYKDVKIARHADLTDEDQTVYYPSIATSAKIDKSKNAIAKGTITVTDTVTYKNLVPGQKYTISGVLMDQGTKKPLQINKKNVTGKATFKASEKGEGTVDVTFKFNADGLGGKSLVVFEDLYYSDVKIASHADIKDQAQTVTLTKPESPKTPPVKTGDTMPIVAAGSIFLLAAVLFVVFARRKRKANG